MAYFEGSNAQANVKGDVGTGTKNITIGGNPNAVKTTQGMVIAVVAVAIIIAVAYIASRRKG